MGCDIHLFTEYKKDDKWNPADIWVFDDRWGDGEKSWRVPSHVQPFNSRHYDFFGFLAGVRSGTWGDSLEPVSAPRGMPSDCCERISTVCADYGCDGHSHSFLTLQELELAWERVKDHSIRYDAYVGTGTPEMKAWFALPEESRPAPKCYAAWSNVGVKAAWHETVESSIGRSYYELRNYLNDVCYEYRVGGDHNLVRAVFWFDN